MGTLILCNSMGPIMVFNAILTSRQSGQKLQCLYGNPIANNFSKFETVT